MTPTYLITSASGHIGQRLVPLILSKSPEAKLVLPTSNASRLEANLPSNVDKLRTYIVEGSIQDPRFVDTLLKEYNVTGVFICLTGDNELFTTFNMFDSIRRSDTAKHVVYISATGDYGLDSQRNGLLQTVWAPSVAVKLIVEAKLRHGLPPRDAEGGFSWTILGPSLFFDNDLRSTRGMLENGIFDAPLGNKGEGRVSENDIALAVANCLEDDGQKYGGKKISIGSLQTYTTQDVAKLWSKALGKEIKPMGDSKADMEDFERRCGQAMGPDWGRSLRLMLEGSHQVPFDMTEAEYREQVELLGKEPESYEKFVEEAARKIQKDQ